MGAVPRALDWDRPPPASAEINWSDPVTDGLVFAFEAASGVRNIVTGADGESLGSGVSCGEGVYGEQLNFSGAQGSRSCSFGGLQVLDGATEATWDILVYFSSANPSAHFFAQWDYENKWLLQASGGYLIWVAADDNSGNRARFDSSGAVFPTAGWYRVIASWRGTAGTSLMVNGIVTDRNASGPAYAIGNVTNLDYLQLGIVNGGSALSGSVAFARAWRRGLSEDEMFSLQQRPWKIIAPEQINVPMAGGGATDYPVTATDALTLADSASQGFGATGVATDAATLADSAAAAMAATSAASDALTLADSASNVAALSAVASDALTLADTLNASTAGNYTATASDALTLADSASNVAALSAAASDALTLADSASNVAALSATASDALTLADTLNASATGDYVVASSDALTLADSAAAAFAAVCIATDAMTLSDATSAALSGQYAVTASDALTLADAASNAAALGVTITEALTLAALVSALNSGTPVLGVRGGFAVQRQLATRRAQIQTARRRN